MVPLHLDITIADLTNVHINPHPNVTVEDLFKVHAQSLDDDGLLQHDHFNAWVFHHDLVHHGPQAFHQFILQLGSPEITVAQKTAPIFSYYMKTHVLLNADTI